MMPDCDVTPVPAETARRRIPRIVYDAGDAAARDLAERFVGLVRASGPAATAFLDALLPDRPRRDIPARRRIDRRGLWHWHGGGEPMLVT